MKCKDKVKVNFALAESCHYHHAMRDHRARTRPPSWIESEAGWHKMADFRRETWSEDQSLKEALDKYVKQGLQRCEILDFVERDFSQYPWSIRTLDRRLRHFQIYYNDNTVEVEDVTAAVANELSGAGKLLGYRAMHKKIRQEYDIKASREQVYLVMQELDPDGLQARGDIGTKKQRKKGNFTSMGSNWVHSLDGHDKLMGYQNSTYPLAIYGCLDTASRKILWLRVWVSNSDPKLIGRWYLEYLFQTRVISAMLRVDRGTETGTMATMHAFLRRHHGDMDPHATVIYGPSTANQVCYRASFSILVTLILCVNF